MDSCVDLHWEKNSLWMLVSKKGELWKGWAVGSDPPPHSIATSQHIPWHPQLLRPEQQPRLSSASFFLLPLSAPFRKSRSQVPNEAALILSFSVKPCTGSKLFNLALPAEGRSLGNQLWDLDITAHGEIFSRGMALHPPVVVRSDPISVNCLFPDICFCLLFPADVLIMHICDWNRRMWQGPQSHLSCSCTYTTCSFPTQLVSSNITSLSTWCYQGSFMLTQWRHPYTEAQPLHMIQKHFVTCINTHGHDVIHPIH